MKVVAEAEAFAQQLKSGNPAMPGAKTRSRIPVSKSRPHPSALEPGLANLHGSRIMPGSRGYKHISPSSFHSRIFTKDYEMTITENSAVTFHYTLTDDDGNEIDSSKGQEPLAYLHGHGNIIPGLEKAMEGKQVGDSFDVSVEAGEGYGESQPHMIQEVPRASFQGIDDIQVGMNFQAETNQGPVPVVVTSVTDETVTVDGNHPLAGKRLHFAVTVESVREATSDELDHGHIHGAGCSH